MLMRNDHRNATHFWLILDDKPVAYMKAFANDESGTLKLELHDIEVRESYRGRGFSTEIMRRACKVFKVENIVHSGGYTPDGFERIAGRVVREGEEDSGPTYDPMTFIKDWDKKEVRFR